MYGTTKRPPLSGVSFSVGITGISQLRKIDDDDDECEIACDEVICESIISCSLFLFIHALIV